jgi:hypothetical protein
MLSQMVAKSKSNKKKTYKTVASLTRNDLFKIQKGPKWMINLIFV